MKFVQAGVLLLGAPMYVAFFASDISVEQSGNLIWLPFVIVGGWNLLVLVAAVITIVDSVLKLHAGKSRQLGTAAMLIKLVGAPFFVASVFVMAGLLWVSFGILLFGGPVLWIVVPIMAVVTYLILLSSSVYGWATIARLRRARTINTVLTIVYTVLLFIPVFDVFAGVLLFGHSRRRPRLTLVILALSSGVLIVAVGLCGILGLFNFLSLTTVPDDPSDPARLIPIVLLLFGCGLAIATGVVAFVVRSNLRMEARVAAVTA